MKPINEMFLWWFVSMLLANIVFMINPLLAIFLAIMMVPIFITDILVKLFVKKKK